MTLTVIDAMNDPEAFEPWFSGESWDAWRVVLKGAYCLPMSPDELVIFGELAGGRAPPRQRVKQLFVIAGRRCGKDSIASLLAANAAAVEQAHIGRLRPGEMAHVVCIACDRDQAKIVSGYARSYFREIGDLGRNGERETASASNLTTASRSHRDKQLSAGARANAPARHPRRGCVLSRRESQFPGRRASPCDHAELDDVAGGDVVRNQSTPYAKRGLLYEMWKAHYGKDSDSVLVIQASSLQLNPTLDPAEIALEREADPAAAVSEWDGQFRADLSTYVSIELIESAVDQGVYVRPPRPEHQYVGFVDSATGVGSDSFAAGIAHKEGELIVLDVAYEKMPPFSPAAAVADVAALFKAYGVMQATGDKFGAGFTIEMFHQHGIEYVYSELDRSQLYIAALPLFSSGRARLLDSKKLVTQFASLERKTSAIGRDVVNHPIGERNHDDLCNAVAGALSLCATAGDDFVRTFISAWGDEGSLAEYDKQLADGRRALIE